MFREISLIWEIPEATTPFYGSRRMAVWLNRQGHTVSRKRALRLTIQQVLKSNRLL